MKSDEQDFSSILYFLEQQNDHISNLRDLIAEEEAALSKSKRDTPAVRRKRISGAGKRPKRIRVYSYTYRRNPDVVAEALIRADGGEVTLDNVIALCPNCHRESIMDSLREKFLTL